MYIFTYTIAMKNIVKIIMSVLFVALVALLIQQNSSTNKISPVGMMPVEPNGGIGDGAESLDDILAGQIPAESSKRIPIRSKR